MTSVAKKRDGVFSPSIKWLWGNYVVNGLHLLGVNCVLGCRVVVTGWLRGAFKWKARGLIGIVAGNLRVSIENGECVVYIVCVCVYVFKWKARGFNGVMLGIMRGFRMRFAGVNGRVSKRGKRRFCVFCECLSSCLIVFMFTYLTAEEWDEE